MYARAGAMGHLKNESLEVRATAVLDLIQPFLTDLDRQLLSIEDASEKAAVVLGLMARLNLSR